MAIAQFNGTTLSIGGSPVEAIKSLNYQGSCAPIPTTASDAALKLFRPGIPSESINASVIGSTTVAKATAGAIAVAWADGGSLGTLTKGRVMKNPGMSGSIDGPNMSTITIKSSK